MRVTQKVKKILAGYEADNPGTKGNLARILMHGKLGGSGKLVILPVDQGFEHGPARSFAPNPAGYDPHYHYQLAVDAGLSAYAAPLGMLEVRRLFSGLSLYCDGVIFALVFRDQIYIKVDDETRTAFEAEGMEPFQPREGRKPMPPADSDGDGVPDGLDDFPQDASETKDSDGDGVGDNADAFPTDPAETADADGDGVGDNSDAFPQNPEETKDADSDGTGDNADECPNDASGIVDSDGDGICDSDDLSDTRL